MQASELNYFRLTYRICREASTAHPAALLFRVRHYTGRVPAPSPPVLCAPLTRPVVPGVLQSHDANAGCNIMSEYSDYFKSVAILPYIYKKKQTYQ